MTPQQDLIQKLKNINVIIDDRKFNQKSKGNLKRNPHLEDLLYQYTSFAPDETDYTTRILLLINEHYDSWPTCANVKCTNKVELSRVFEDRGKFAQFCCVSCRKKDKPPKNTPEQTKAKRNATNLAKYGHTCCLGNVEVQEKRKNTNIERYGVDNLFKTEEGQQKAKQGIIDKYGVDSVFKVPEIREKINRTFMEKYGTVNPSSCTHIKEKTEKTNLERYGVRRPLQDPNKVKEMQEYFFNTYSTHPKKRHITPEMYNKLEDVEWLKDQHITQQKTQTKLSEEIGVSRAVVKRALLEANIVPIRHPNSQGERDVANFIKSLGHEIQTNNRSILKGKELDIYIKDKSVAIEYNGTYFHSTLRYENDYHLNKTKKCEDLSIRLIHLADSEWLENTEAAKVWLKNQVDWNVHPNDSELVEEIDIEKAEMLFDKNCVGDFKETNRYFVSEDAFVSFSNAEDNVVNVVQFYGTPWKIKKIIKHVADTFSLNFIHLVLDRSKYDGNFANCMGFLFCEELPPSQEGAVWNCGFTIWKWNNAHH